MYDEFNNLEGMSFSSSQRNLVTINKETQEKTRDLFKRRLIYTDLHGIHKVFDERSWCPKRFIYGSVIIILLSVLTRFWIQVVQKLRDPPIKTSRGLISLSDDDTVLFPAITICYYAQYTYDFIRKNKDLKGFVIESWPDILSGELVRELKFEWNETEIKKNFSNPEETLSKASQFSGTRFIECEFNTLRYPCHIILERVLTDFGFCVRFNDHGNYTLARAGLDNGLHLFTYIDDRDGYLGANYGASGIRVAIHRPGTEPDVSNYGFWVSAASDTQVALTATTTLLVEKNGCRSELPDLPLNENYTINRCKLNCIQRCITNRCSCKLIYMPGNIEICNSIESIRCAYLAKEECHRLKGGCLCPYPCNTIGYESSVSVARFPTMNFVNFYSKYTNITKKDARKGGTKLSVFLKTTKTLVLQQYADYSWTDMLSELGGQLGLFLGASILTIFQIVEIFITIIIKLIRVRRKKIKIKPME